MTKFDFATANRIVFGKGTFSRTDSFVSEYGSRVLLVHARGAAVHTHQLQKLLSDHGMEVTSLEVSGEPTVSLAEEGVLLARAHDVDVVVGLGGGSALDTAKAVAALMTNPGDILDYLEVVGKGKLLTQAPVPWVGVPTTAGTGSEVTRNAVLAVPGSQVKVSLRSPAMLARVAVIDPELTYNLPQDVTASTGMDALTQVIEPYVSKRANGLTDLYCREGIMRGAKAIRWVYEHGQDGQAREDMAYTSLLGGLALANAGLGAVHGFAAPIGGMFPAPHGAVCARLLPLVVRANIKALQDREPNHPALQRYREVAGWLIGNEEAEMKDGVRWLEETVEFLHLPRLASYGITVKDIPGLVEKSSAASSMQANPIRLSESELTEILAQAF